MIPMADPSPTDANEDLYRAYEEKKAVVDEIRTVLATVAKTDKYAKVIAESLLNSLRAIEEKHARLTRERRRP